MVSAVSGVESIHITTHEIGSPSPTSDTTDHIAKRFLRTDNRRTFPKAAIHASRYSEQFGTLKGALISRKIKSTGNFLGGAMIGNTLAFLSTSTGVNTALHEHVGHGLLGLGLTHNYPEDIKPSFQVDGWGNFKAIFQAGSFSEAMKLIWRFLTAFDFNGDGASGFTSYSNSHKNELGKYMGKNGHDAWVSIAGSLPSLAVNSVSVAGGMAVKDKSPLLGWSMVSYGVIQHLLSSSYSWSAATMSPERLVEKASSGHDFANLAVNLSEITGLPSQDLAIGTSIAWTSLVPALALGLYFHQKSKQLDIVPDHVAIQNLLFKAMSDESSAELITRSLESYPRKKTLDSLWKKGMAKDDESFTISYALLLELRRYTEHLINSLPQKSMNASKKEVIRRYAKLQKIDRIGQALSIISVAGTIAALASRILKILGATIAPFLATASTALSFSSPLLTGVSVISGGYETYKDLATSSRKVPKRAKVVSTAKLVVTAVSAIGLAVGAMIPALYLAAVASVLANIIGGLALGYARQKIIKQRFGLLNSIEQGNWNMMVNLLEIYRKDKGDIDVKKSDATYRGLYRWMQFQKSADKKGFLKDNQRHKLVDIGLLPKENQ